MGEIYFILGLSGWARILNLFQVPTRFVWRLPDSVFSEIYFILGLSGWTRILSLFFGLLWPDTFTELGFLVPLVLLGDY